MNKKRIYSNYKRKHKWLGIIDYKSLVFLIIYLFILYNLISIIPLQIMHKIYLFLFLSIPLLSIFIININNENVIDTLIIIINFYINKKIFIKKFNLFSSTKIINKKIYKKIVKNSNK